MAGPWTRRNRPNVFSTRSAAAPATPVPCRGPPPFLFSPSNQGSPLVWETCSSPLTPPREGHGLAPKGDSGGLIWRGRAGGSTNGGTPRPSPLGWRNLSDATFRPRRRAGCGWNSRLLAEAYGQGRLGLGRHEERLTGGRERSASATVRKKGLGDRRTIIGTAGLMNG